MRVLRPASIVAVAVGALLIVGVGATSAQAAPRAPRSAPSDVAAPTVTPNPVAPGQTITVSGTDCTGSELLGVDVEVLDSDFNSIAYSLVDASDISQAGAWTTTIHIPGGTAAGDYTVASLCDDYEQGFIYDPVDLKVTSPLVPPPSGPAATMTLSASTVAAGDTLKVTGEGFGAGEKVVVTLHSTPVTLAILIATSSGTVSGEVTIPASTTVGAHTIVLTGGTTNRSTSESLTVTAASGSTMPTTGNDVDNRVPLAALALILAGGGALIVSRRRHAPTHRRSHVPMSH